MTRYGMVIDLSRCTGCRACMVACKVENNTPQANLWMYVFRFEEGEFPNTRVWFMPRPCMHCDNAPCVKVCPVGARHKREDGLTATDWDRCIGCRYCEVSCPYGVNYFNWKDPGENLYLNWDDPDLAQFTDGESLPYSNPDLDGEYGPEQRRTAGGGRHKGVMDKCTFCVQRIQDVRQRAKSENRPIGDGEIRPACAVACPADAIVFGDLKDPTSEVARLASSDRGYKVLEELGVRPSVTYLAEIVNPQRGY